MEFVLAYWRHRVACDALQEIQEELREADEREQAAYKLANPPTQKVDDYGPKREQKRADKMAKAKSGS